MGIPAHVYSFVTKDYHTETAATAIDETIDAVDGERLALLGLEYVAGATAHVASFMYAEDAAGYAGSSRNTCDGGAVSGQKVINVDTTPRDPAGNAAAASDIIAFQLTDGTWEWDTIASVATKAITCTNNIAGVDNGGGAAAIADGAPVLILGVVGDGMSQKLALAASVTTEYGPDEIVLVHPHIGEPWYLTINNATNAGFLYHLTAARINK